MTLHFHQSSMRVVRIKLQPIRETNLANAHPVTERRRKREKGGERERWKEGKRER